MQPLGPARLLAALCVLAAAASGGAAAGWRPAAGRRLQQAPPVCDPGYYAPNASEPCIACGWDAYCRGGRQPPGGARTECRLSGTFTDTASSAAECLALPCDPCGSASPDVIFTTGAGAQPPNAIWIIRNYSASEAPQPAFVCAMSGLSGQIGDVAILFSKDVFVVDTGGFLRHIPAVAWTNLSPTTAHDRACPTSSVPLIRLPAGRAYTGLAAGFRSNLLYASTSQGDVLTIMVQPQDISGTFNASIVTTTRAVCDPLSGLESSNGGTDLTPGPDGAVHRWCARAPPNRFTTTRMRIDPTTGWLLPGVYNYTTRSLSQGGQLVDTSYSNGAAFCTSSGVVAAAVLSTPGNQIGFFRISGPGIRNDLLASQVPPAELINLTLNDTSLIADPANLVPDSLRVNGATSLPQCQRGAIKPAVLSVQVKWLALRAAPDVAPLVAVTRPGGGAGGTPVCEVSNTSYVGTSAALLHPQPARSLCGSSGSFPYNPTVTFSVRGEVLSDVALPSVRCYDVSQGADAAFDITSPGGGGFRSLSSAITCVVEYRDLGGACAPGWWQPNATAVCQRCGYNYACPGNEQPPAKARVPCGMFVGTPNDTSTACEPLLCEPCWQDTPDVFFSVGPNASPTPNGLYRIAGFDPTSPSGIAKPQFLCQLDNFNTIGDIALLWTGDLVATDTSATNAQIRYITAARLAELIATPANSTTRKCNSVQLALTNGGVARGITGLSAGFRSDALYASTSDGDVITFLLQQSNTTGKLTATVAARVVVPCDPLPKTAGVNGTNGGTDVTPGPDGYLYRWTAKDAQTKYTATRLVIDASTGVLSTTAQFSYTNRLLGTGVDASNSNAGAFCTRSLGPIGTSSTGGGLTAVFWAFGAGAPGLTSNYDALLPAQMIGNMTTDATSYLINGAAVLPRCGPVV